MVFLPQARLRYLILCWIREPTASVTKNNRPELTTAMWDEIVGLSKQPWNGDARKALAAVLGVPGLPPLLLHTVAVAMAMPR